MRINKLLIANRGEIAIRIARAARDLGIRTVAIYATDDAATPHRWKADEAYEVSRTAAPTRQFSASVKDHTPQPFAHVLWRVDPSSWAGRTASAHGTRGVLGH